MRCPGELYAASHRKYDGTPEDLEYPQMCTRRVSNKGTIRVDGPKALPQYEFGGLVGRAQTHHGKYDGSLVWATAVGPSKSGDEQFYSGGYPPEIKLQMEQKK
jgi:hypothetical protein